MATREKKKNVPGSAEIGNDANGVATMETIQIIFPEIKQPRNVRILKLAADFTKNNEKLFSYTKKLLMFK